MDSCIVFGKEARDGILEGINTVSNVVKITLGPNGRNVVIDKTDGSPRVTKDGVTVAREITLNGGLENTGVKMLKEVAVKTNDVVGDGTTTATVLTQMMVNEGLKAVNSGSNPIDVRKGMTLAVEEVVRILQENSRKVSGLEEIIHVGTIAANGDRRIGLDIGEALQRVGNDGIVTVEETKALESGLELVDGMRFDRGYISRYFLPDQTATTCNFQHPYVLVCDEKITSIKSVLPVLEIISGTDNSLVIIAEDIEGEALTTLLLNKFRGKLKLVGVKSPGFGDRKQQMLEDISLLTGAKIIGSSLGLKLEDITISQLGKAARIVVDKDTTTIIDGLGDKVELRNKIRQIKQQWDVVESEYEKEKLHERLARLTGGIAMIKVGGSTEIEIKEKRDRVEDALNATRSAIHDGIIAGGGTALFWISKRLNIELPNKDQQIGLNIIKNSLTSPIKQIIINSGMDPDLILKNIEVENKIAYGYDVRGMKYGDLIVFGIIDPVKVVEMALTEAVSVAGLVVTTEVAIVNKPKQTEGSASKESSDI
ncbi:60 kDa chaperonin [Candidatus Hodgkinia cicadicola]|uniref:60 kDa chaperonin n=1 Tax=Candidatus Hodgkinia cicadicola TaxID=573658 RepID=A0ABX4MF74_9HYPH|nr:60 kDa chaperonin [Candidatus Hodgkinia cicadicola]